jgi:hypothetical protein
VGGCGRTLANPLLTLLTSHQVLVTFVAHLYRDGVVIAGWVTAGWIPDQRVTVAGCFARSCCSGVILWRFYKRCACCSGEALSERRSRFFVCWWYTPDLAPDL